MGEILWFVTYEIRRGMEIIGAGPQNIILRGIHPIEWAANPPKNNIELGWVTYLIWFCEIEWDFADLTSKVSFWCDVIDRSSYSAKPGGLVAES